MLIIQGVFVVEEISLGICNRGNALLLHIYPALLCVPELETRGIVSPRGITNDDTYQASFLLKARNPKSFHQL